MAYIHYTVLQTLQKKILFSSPLSREALNLAESLSQIPIKRERDIHSDTYSNSHRDEDVAPPPPKRGLSIDKHHNNHSHHHNHHLSSSTPIVGANTNNHHLHPSHDDMDGRSDVSLNEHATNDEPSIAVDARQLSPSRPPSSRPTRHQNGTTTVHRTSSPTTSGSPVTLLSGMQFKITSRGKCLVADDWNILF